VCSPSWMQFDRSGQGQIHTLVGAKTQCVFSAVQIREETFQGPETLETPNWDFYTMLQRCVSRSGTLLSKTANAAFSGARAMSRCVVSQGHNRSAAPPRIRFHLLRTRHVISTCVWDVEALAGVSRCRVSLIRR